MSSWFFHLRFKRLTSLVFLFAFAVVLSSMPGCRRSDSYGELQDDVPASELSKCERQMQLTIPSSAKAIGIWRQNESQESVKLKLEMNRNDVTRLLETSPFAGKPLLGDSAASFGPNVEWWDPGKRKTMEVGHAVLPDEAGELSIGIDQESNDSYYVYLVWVEN